MNDREHILFRPESPADRSGIRELLLRAFGREEEAVLVDRLREGDTFLPELALVAVAGETVCAYVLLTRIWISDGKGHSCESLALAPVAVLPDWQNKGIGSGLIRDALEKARKLTYSSVVVLGHPAYYRRFGFEAASDRHIKAPFETNPGSFMVIELIPGALENCGGTVQYPEVFLDV